MTDPGWGAPSGDEARVQELLSAKWVAQALSTAASLGVFDGLDEQPKTAVELASVLGCEPGPLKRLLRVLCGEGLTFEEIDGTFRTTELGKRFGSKGRGELAHFVGSKSQWMPWAFLPEAIRTGKNAFELAHGRTLFEYLREHPEDAALYHAAVDAFTSAQADALSELPLFSTIHSVVDVGGGRGKLLDGLLSRQPHMRGTLFDLPEVIDMCRELSLEARYDGRLELVAGDFFEGLPAGRDCYIFKHVLHNWEDDEALKLLRCAAAAMSRTGTIIVVEDLSIPGNHRDLARYMDLEMFVVTGGGRERSKAEFRSLLGRAGLSLKESVRLTGGTFALLVARREE